MRRYLIGVDIGTSACKVGLFDNSGNKISTALFSYKTFYPQKNFAEQDPDSWWDAVKQGIQKVLKESAINPKNIKAVGVDSMTPVLLAVNKNGLPIYPALIWSDKRAEEECKWIDGILGKEKIFNLSGNKTKSVYLAPKIIWFKNNRPDLFKKTFSFLQPNGYINYKLCNVFSMDRSHSELTLLADKFSGEWNSEVCKILGIPFEKLPEIKDCDSVVGYITEYAASQTGLIKGIPVIAGGNDCAVTVFAMDITRKGRSFLEMGFASNLGICLDSPKSSATCDLYHHVVKNKWILQSYSATAGAALRWFKEEICNFENVLAEQKNIDPYKYLDALASKISIGSNNLIFIPYLEGLALNPSVKGAFLGLSTSTTKAHMIRALLEGCAYANRKNMEAVESAGQTEISEIFMVGGGSNSSLWAQIHADTLNKKIIINNIKDTTILGSALLAGIATGEANKVVGDEQIIKQDHIFVPIKKNRQIYNELYNKFNEYLKKNYTNE